MRVETIEQLLCPGLHVPSPLITVAFDRDGDWLIDGLLGCSVCGAEYVMAAGVVHFDAHQDPTTGSHGQVTTRDATLPDESFDAMRVAALLGLSEPGMRVVLCGAFGHGAPALELATGARCLVVNAPSHPAVARGVDHILMRADATLPVANGAMHGMVIDAMHIAQLERAALVVRTGGRVLAPSYAPVPRGCQELARDAQQWVAQVDASMSAFVPLQMRRRPETTG
jgi:hypothetical protein